MTGSREPFAEEMTARKMEEKRANDQAGFCKQTNNNNTHIELVLFEKIVQLTTTTTAHEDQSRRDGKRETSAKYGSHDVAAP